MAVQWPILIGAIAGLLAKLIISGFGSGGLVLRVIVGIAGALFAAYAGDTIGMYRAGETGGLLGAALGAVVMLVIYQLLSRRDASSDATPRFMAPQVIRTDCVVIRLPIPVDCCRCSWLRPSVQPS